MPDVVNVPSAPDKLPSGLPAAFALTGTPSRLPGGQGTCWRVGDAVLKPGQDRAEASWLAEMFADLTGPGFRVPRPVRAVDGSWVVAGWTAWAWVDGEPDPLARWPELIEVSRAFHAALAGRGRPGWVGRGTSPWAAADRVAWGEATAELAPELADLVTALLAAMRPVPLPSQLVHGDIAGNVLFAAGQSPAVIDFSP
ncbi:MAG: phosphotransferase [Streptosporangiaceae bacterium]